VEVAGGTPWPIGLAKVEFGWVATEDEWPDIPVVPEPAVPELCAVPPVFADPPAAAPDDAAPPPAPPAPCARADEVPAITASTKTADFRESIGLSPNRSRDKPQNTRLFQSSPIVVHCPGVHPSSSDAPLGSVMQKTAP
jgi:hypothetical protein